MIFKYGVGNQSDLIVGALIQLVHISRLKAVLVKDVQSFNALN